MGAAELHYEPTPGELAFIRRTHAHCAALLLICGGFDPALRAGILDGKRATAPRALVPMLQKVASGTEWLEKRYVNDGKVWTSGALLAGLDMMRAFVLSVWGLSESDSKAANGGTSLIEFMLEFGCWPDRGAEYSTVTAAAAAAAAAGLA
jgi:transcriptional regulator GlxA family with amidase domain